MAYQMLFFCQRPPYHDHIGLWIFMNVVKGKCGQIMMYDGITYSGCRYLPTTKSFECGKQASLKGFVCRTANPRKAFSPLREDRHRRVISWVCTGLNQQVPEPGGPALILSSECPRLAMQQSSIEGIFGYRWNIALVACWCRNKREGWRPEASRG